MTSEDSKNLTETRRAILKRKYGHLYLEEELVNDWFTWENPNDPVPVVDGAGSYIEDTARALALVDKYIRGMGGRIQVESDAIIHAPSMGYDAEVTLKMGFHPPSLHEYLARSEAQGSDKA
jgi:hypothetical protein